MKPTVKDVAARAGVSPITVSRVINGGPLVSEKTRKAVLDAVAEMGYKSDLLARSLVHGRAAPLVGFVATELANPFYAPIISAVQEVARLRDHLVVIADSERQLANESTYLQQFERLRNRRRDCDSVVARHGTARGLTRCRYPGRGRCAPLAGRGLCNCQ